MEAGFVHACSHLEASAHGSRELASTNDQNPMTDASLRVSSADTLAPALLDYQVAPWSTDRHAPCAPGATLCTCTPSNQPPSSPPFRPLSTPARPARAPYTPPLATPPDRDDAHPRQHHHDAGQHGGREALLEPQHFHRRHEGAHQQLGDLVETHLQGPVPGGVPRGDVLEGVMKGMLAACWGHTRCWACS